MLGFNCARFARFVRIGIDDDRKLQTPTMHRYRLDERVAFEVFGESDGRKRATKKPGAIRVGSTVGISESQRGDEKFEPRNEP
jgi:hypothetical protein